MKESLFALILVIVSGFMVMFDKLEKIERRLERDKEETTKGNSSYNGPG